MKAGLPAARVILSERSEPKDPTPSADGCKKAGDSSSALPPRNDGRRRQAIKRIKRRLFFTQPPVVFNIFNRFFNIAVCRALYGVFIMPEISSAGSGNRLSV